MSGLNNVKKEIKLQMITKTVNELQNLIKDAAKYIFKKPKN